MHRNDELDRDLAWFRQELNRLDDPELPPSLSAEKLFSRLEELEQAEQESGRGWTPSLLCAFTGGSGAWPRWTHWKPMLTAAAVFMLVAVVYSGRMLPVFQGGSNAAAPMAMSSQAMSADTAADADAGTGSAAQVESYQADAMTDGVLGGENGAAEEKALADPSADQSVPKSYYRSARTSEAYDKAMGALCVSLAVTGQDAGEALETRPDLLYTQADLVVSACVVPGFSTYTLQAEPQAQGEMTVCFTLKGDAQPDSVVNFTYAGGCMSVSDYLETGPLPAQEAQAELTQASALPWEEIQEAYLYFDLGERPRLETDGQYVLFLTQTEEGYRLMDSQYAVLPVDAAGNLTDYTGRSWGTEESPTFL